MNEPIFVKGDLSFTTPDGKSLIEYTRKDLSLFGCTSLPWAPLNPKDHFGHTVKVQIKIVPPGALHLEAQAILMHEQALNHDLMGLRFVLSREQRHLLSDQIKRFGYLPTDHVRKYPRIPSMSMIQTFPLRAIVKPAARPSGTEAIPIVFDVGNLSPNGILLTTENRIAIATQPGQRILISLEPRGPFSQTVETEGLICRATDSLNLENGNMVRMLGIKFIRVDELNRAAFLDLLKDILERMKGA